MADSLNSLTYSTITGRFIALITDSLGELAPDGSDDLNDLPDVVPLVAQVTITPSIPRVLVQTSVFGPLTVELAPHIVQLDGSGRIFAGGNTYVKVVATDTENANPSGFTYRVSFMNASYAGRPVVIPPFDIAAPGNTTVDLTAAAPIPSSPGTIVVRDEAAAKAAQAAAEVAATSANAYAASAAAAALRAEAAAARDKDLEARASILALTGRIMGAYHQWTGNVNASPSERYEGNSKRVNLIRDPRALNNGIPANSATYWAPNAVTWSSVPMGMRLTPAATTTAYVYAIPSAAVAAAGGASGRFAMTPGQSFALSMEVYNSGTTTLWVAAGTAFYNSAGAGGASPSQLTSRIPLAPGETVTLERRGTVPLSDSTVVGTLPLLYLYSSAAGGVALATNVVDTTNWIFEIGNAPFDVASTYFDGSSISVNSGVHYRWLNGVDIGPSVKAFPGGRRMNWAQNPRGATAGGGLNANSSANHTVTKGTAVAPTPLGTVSAAMSQAVANVTTPATLSMYNVDGLINTSVKRSVGAYVMANASGYVARLTGVGVTPAFVPLTANVWTWISVANASGYISAAIQTANGNVPASTDRGYITDVLAVIDGGTVTAADAFNGSVPSTGTPTPATAYVGYAKPVGGIPNSDLATPGYVKPASGIPASDLAFTPYVKPASGIPASDLAFTPYVKPGGGIPASDLAFSPYIKPGGGIPNSDLATPGYTKPSGGIPNSDLARPQVSKVLTARLDNTTTTYAGTGQGNESLRADLTAPGTYEIEWFLVVTGDPSLDISIRLIKKMGATTGYAEVLGYDIGATSNGSALLQRTLNMTVAFSATASFGTVATGTSQIMRVRGVFTTTAETDAIELVHALFATPASGNTLAASILPGSTCTCTRIA